MPRASLKETLKLANAWREKSGQDILSDFLPSIPDKPRECLLARAFNKDCFITYITCNSRNDEHEHILVGREHRGGRMESGSGRVIFNRLEDAHEFADLTGFDLVGPLKKSVRLPDEIALVAWEFDNGSYKKYRD